MNKTTKGRAECGQRPVVEPAKPAKGQESKNLRMKTDTALHCVLATYYKVKTGPRQEKVGTNRSK